MILLIDIGNSRSKYVQCVDGRLSDTDQLANQDFNHRYFNQYFAKASRMIVANVAKSSLTTTLALWCAEQGIVFQQVHSEQKKAALVSAYQQPTTLGIDRWLALLGALHLYPNKNVLIIDAGTATTIDLLQQDGQHQGGWILAGIKALFNSVLNHSTLVNAENKTVPNLAFGTNTSDNVNNACWAATIGLIQQAISQAQQLSHIDHILLTGGNGQMLAKLLTAQGNNKDAVVQNVQFIDNLIFYGLREYVPQ
ncbi:MAG: type III pantothenate kinase [Colwellia sp.]